MCDRFSYLVFYGEVFMIKILDYIVAKAEFEGIKTIKILEIKLEENPELFQNNGYDNKIQCSIFLKYFSYIDIDAKIFFLTFAIFYNFFFFIN